MQDSKPMLWPRDGWYVSLVIDRFSVPITYRLAKTSISPNQVTVIAIILKIIAVTMIWFELPWLNFAFWQIGFLFDCVDGPLARLTKNFSKYGELLDHGGDIVMQWAFSLSVAIHVLLPVQPLLALLTIIWTGLWMINWKMVEGQEGNIADTGLGGRTQNSRVDRYKKWTARHRLKLVPITGIEEVTLIFPLGYALGWLGIILPLLVVYRAFVLGLRLIVRFRKSNASS
jgi:phosphatidylglycerophosphate synthase